MRRFTELGEAEREEYLSSLYLAMIRLGSPTRNELEAAGRHPADIDRAAQVLVERGLVLEESGASWEVLPPEAALPGQAERWEDRARSARTTAAELGAIWRTSRGDTASSRPPVGLELLGSVEQVVLAALALAGSAEQRLRLLLDGSPAALRLVLTSRILERSPLPEACTSVVLDVRMFDHDDVLPVLEKESNRGQRIRAADGVPFGILVVDERVALVDLTSHEGGEAGSMVVRRRAAVSALSALVDVAHELATPVAPTLARSAQEHGDAPLEQRDLRILSLLATGASDQQIARHVRISTRTVERRVAALMRRLGAATRFQAGVQAGRRGWI